MAGRQFSSLAGTELAGERSRHNLESGSREDYQGKVLFPLPRAKMD
jgi:hypothetical protein